MYSIKSQNIVEFVSSETAENIYSNLTRSTACNSRPKNIIMGKMFLAVIFLAIYQRSISVQDCKVTFRNGFNLESNEIRNRMFSRRRIPEQIPTVLSRKVQTVMECLDACLRSDRCVSFDVEAKPLQLKVCRIFGEVESMLPLVEGGNSIHFNLSSKLLRQVSQTKD